MKKFKKTAALLIAAGMALGSSITSFAAWHSDSNGCWWQNDDGTRPADTWQWIDGDNDGLAECYYFDSNGYVLKNTVTPDGYTVDANGALTINGQICRNNHTQTTHNSNSHHQSQHH